MEKLKRAIQNALAKSSLHFTLKKEQMECLSSVITDGKDILAVLPTGYGKSLIYQLLPDVFNQYLVVQDSIVLVISPLNALMYDQIAKLNKQSSYEITDGRTIQSHVSVDIHASRNLCARKEIYWFYEFYCIPRTSVMCRC